MSLSVNVFSLNPDGSMELIEPKEHSQELAGFESYRQKLYGSKVSRELGFQLLPTLDGSDLYCVGDEVIQLREEANKAIENIELFVEELGVDAEMLSYRFDNIINATKLAEQIDGGVVIR